MAATSAASPGVTRLPYDATGRPCRSTRYFWKFHAGAVPVAWTTWITRAVPDEAESAGGLFVAAINFAIATGAAAGGAIFDASGVTSVFVVSGVVLFLAALTIVSAVRTHPA